MGGYRPWAELLERTFAVDVLTCARCPVPRQTASWLEKRNTRATRRSLISRTAGGRSSCFVEEAPAAISQGETRAEAKANLRDALKLVMECQRELVRARVRRWVMPSSQR